MLLNRIVMILEKFMDKQDENTASFAWAVDQEGGKHFPSRGKAYPGFFAQIYPVTFGVISPASGKAILAYQKLNEELPRWDPKPQKRIWNEKGECL